VSSYIQVIDIHGSVGELSALDRAICRSYAWKMQGKVTDHAFDSMRFACPQTFNDDGLPNLHTHRSRIAFLSELDPERYHCCPNSCICYAGPYADHTECRFCHEIDIALTGSRGRFSRTSQLRLA
jgi:hypothetical protein